MPELILVAKTKDVPPGESRVFIVRGNEIALFNVDGRFFAVNNLCPHQGGPLVVGSIKGKVLTCPWHFWQFNLESGRLVSNYAVSVTTYPVKVEKDEIRIEWEVKPAPGDLQ